MPNTLIKGQEVCVVFHADGAVLDGLLPTAASVESRGTGTRLVLVAKVVRGQAFDGENDIHRRAGRVRGPA